MIKLSALFWLVLVAATGFAMFAVKYEVEALADELAQTVKQADDTGRDIRVLDAEWAYLNRPDTLAQMNQRHLSLVPIATKQLIVSLANIPMRPTPPPPVQIVAAAAETSADSNAPLPPGSTTQPPPSAAQPIESPAAEQKSSPSEPPQAPASVETAAVEGRGAAAAPKPVLIKAAQRRIPAHRAKSLDELIAQISESR